MNNKDILVIQQEEYEKRRIEHLQNSKPFERYILFDTGSAFVIADKLKHEKEYSDKSGDYVLVSDMFNSSNGTCYKTKEEFMDLLNHLDRTVNGNLYEQHEEDLLSKDIVYDQLLSQIDNILNNIDDKNNDKFEVTYHKFKPWDGFANAITIQGNVYRDLLHEAGYAGGSLKDNKVFLKIMQTINKELDKYKHEKNNDMIDYLTELKGRIMEDLHTI